MSNYFCTHIFRLLDFDTDDITKYFFPLERGRLSGPSVGINNCENYCIFNIVLSI